jgi:hypothetical protein
MKQIIALLYGTLIMSLAAKAATKYTSVDEYKAALANDVQSHHQIPGFFRGIAVWLIMAPQAADIPSYIVALGLELGVKPPMVSVGVV